LLSKNYSFTLTVQSDCVNTKIIDKTLIDMTNYVSVNAVSQEITFEDTIAKLHAVPDYCGAREYSLTPALSFLTISGTTLSLATSFVSDVSVTNVEMKVSLTSYSGVTSIMKNFVVTIKCKVLNIKANIAPMNSKYNIKLDPPLILPFNFTQFPACGLKYSISPVVPFPLTLLLKQEYHGQIEITN